MQQFVVNSNDWKNKNSTSETSTTYDANRMPPQANMQAQTSTMQEIHQSFPHLNQLNQLQNSWAEDSQQGDALSIRTSLEDTSSEAAKLIQNLNRSSSPTSVSLGSSSVKSNASSSRGAKRSSSGSSLSKNSANGLMNSPTNNNNAAFKAYPGVVKRGSGVDIKGPTPEVAQQLRFPWKLHLLLERCEYEYQQKLAAAAAEGTSPNRVPDMPISWLPTGKAFKVHDKERFVKEVMPSFFGTQSFKTFQRNLNLWGFTRVSKGPQKDVCSHPLFLKGFPAVCQSMKRIVLKGTGRGNRAPLGGVDVSSVQAVVAAAAMQQQQQQQAAHQQILGQGLNQISPQILQHQQQFQQQNKADAMSPQLNPLSQINFQNPQQLQLQQPNQLQSQQQQQQFVIENGTIQAAPMSSQQKLVVLPSASPASATTTVMWPNNQQQQQQPSIMQQQSFSPADANASLQKSLQQLSTIIQQLNGCNSAPVNTNTVQNNNTSSFQQAPNPMPMQQQQPGMMQPQQQQQLMSNPSAVVTPSPISTQDLVTLLLQRNLQQQVSQAPQQPQASPIQLQVPSSLFPSNQPMQQQQQPQPSMSLTNNSNSTSFVPLQQQPITNPTNTMFSQPGAAQQPNSLVSNSPTPTASNQQQQNQLLQLLLQQNGWSTSAAPI